MRNHISSYRCKFRAINQLSGRVKGVRGLPVTGVEKIMASKVGCPSAVFACVRLALRLVWSRRVLVLS